MLVRLKEVGLLLLVGGVSGGANCYAHPYTMCL
jgi:hypothetical protein